MSINNTFTTIKKFLTPNLSCDNIFICLGDVAQLARASGSYPAGRVFESHRRYHLKITSLF